METKRLLKVRHIEGDEVVVSAATYATKEFDLVDPWFDLQAKLVLGGTVHSSAPMFGASFGPHKVQLDKKGTKHKDMVAKIVAEMDEEEQRNGASSTASSGFLSEAAAKHTEESLEKARAKLAQKQQSKRRIEMS